MRRSLVVANWKMHGSLNDNNHWIKNFKSSDLKQLTNTDIVICPSYPYLAQLQQSLLGQQNSHIFLGTQDVSSFANGAYTGQVSLSMIKDFSVNYVILGHSERRALCFEDDKLVADKAKAVMAGGLNPIVCLGETLEERETNKTHQVIKRQLQAVLDSVKSEDNLSNLVIAYEPVWAIGTGLNATAEQAQEVHRTIREQLTSVLSAELAANIRVIYGGSVKPNNAQELFNQPDIDGGLIGGASLDAGLFLEICTAATGRK